MKRKRKMRFFYLDGYRYLFHKGTGKTLLRQGVPWLSIYVGGRVEHPRDKHMGVFGFSGLLPGARFWAASVQRWMLS